MFNVDRVITQDSGTPYTLEYRLNFYYKNPNAALRQISPWHDVPLYRVGHGADGQIYNMVCEIPRYTRAKFECSTGEPYNPIKVTPHSNTHTHTSGVSPWTPLLMADSSSRLACDLRVGDLLMDERGQPVAVTGVTLAYVPQPPGQLALPPHQLANAGHAHLPPPRRWWPGSHRIASTHSMPTHLQLKHAFHPDCLALLCCSACACACVCE